MQSILGDNKCDEKNSIFLNLQLSNGVDNVIPNNLKNW